MTTQLQLIDTDPVWRLDEATKETGRRGLASARAALAEHRPAGRPPSSHDDDRRRAA